MGNLIIYKKYKMTDFSSKAVQKKKNQKWESSHFQLKVKKQLKVWL